METLIAYFSQHPFLLVGYVVAAQWVFSAFVSSMPEPTRNASHGYIWAYRFLHLLAANLSTVKVSIRNGKPVISVPEVTEEPPAPIKKKEIIR